MADTYYSGQGRVLVAKRGLNGDPLSMRFIGNVPEFKISPKSDVLEHKESTTGQRAVDKRIAKGKSLDVSATLEDFQAKNLELVMYGESTLTPAVIAETTDIPASPAVGSVFSLGFMNVSNVVITNFLSATVVPAINYTVDPVFGTVKVNIAFAGTGIYVATFDAGAATTINIFSQPIPEVYMRVEGLNTADDNKPVLIELYRVATDPAKELGFINDDFGKYELSGSVLADSTKPAGGYLGQFGRVVLA